MPATDARGSRGWKDEQAQRAQRRGCCLQVFILFLVVMIPTIVAPSLWPVEAQDDAAIRQLVFEAKKRRPDGIAYPVKWHCGGKFNWRGKRLPGIWCGYTPVNRKSFTIDGRTFYQAARSLWDRTPKGYYVRVGTEWLDVQVIF